MFKDHHYLDGNINKASRCYIAIWEGQVIGFSGTITLPSGTLKNAWRGHRTVILPDFQGMGVGVRFSDAIGQLHIDQGLRYFSRTAHPRMAEYRNASPLWKPTSKNKKLRKDVSDSNSYKNHVYDNVRICSSHEYVGNSQH